MSEEDLLILNVHRIGPAWNRAVAFRAGQCDDQLCTLCGETGMYDLIFTCKALQLDREKADKLISTIDATQLHASIKCGIAPAMKTVPRKPVWGGDEQFTCRETWSETLGLRKILGCEAEKHIPDILKRSHGILITDTQQGKKSGTRYMATTTRRSLPRKDRTAQPRRNKCLQRRKCQTPACSLLADRRGWSSLARKIP